MLDDIDDDDDDDDEDEEEEGRGLGREFVLSLDDVEVDVRLLDTKALSSEPSLHASLMCFSNSLKVIVLLLPLHKYEPRNNILKHMSQEIHVIIGDHCIVS